MLKIRLQRVGRKNVPTFRVVLTDSKNSTKSGKAKEVLGMYDPVHNNKTVKADRIKYWISVGAQLSGTMHNFLIQEKIISGKKINVLPKKRPIVSDSAKATTDEKEAAKAEGAAPASAEAPAGEPTEKKPAEVKAEEKKEDSATETSAKEAAKA